MIHLKDTRNADTRTADHVVSRQELHEASFQHITEVEEMLDHAAKYLQRKGLVHDFDKVIPPGSNAFYKAFHDDQTGVLPFTESEWYKKHYSTQAHHNYNTNSNVDFFDLIEAIIDVTCAAKGRGGEAKIEVSDEALRRAFNNTIKWVDDLTEKPIKKQK